MSCNFHLSHDNFDFVHRLNMQKVTDGVINSAFYHGTKNKLTSLTSFHEVVYNMVAKQLGLGGVEIILSLGNHILKAGFCIPLRYHTLHIREALTSGREERAKQNRLGRDNSRT